ncbi:YetF domain-containing protein [Rhodococcus pyridinivorans]
MGVTRLVGRSSVGELSTFQLVLFVAMGDLVQQGITQDDVSMTSAVLTIGVFAVLTLALSMINARFPRMRGITHGVPVVIVQDGEPDLQNLKRERLSLDDLMAAARQQGIRRFADIDLAVLETNGRISFFARTSAQDGAPEEPDPA